MCVFGSGLIKFFPDSNSTSKTIQGNLHEENISVANFYIDLDEWVQKHYG